jgi:hypothetical protein
MYTRTRVELFFNASDIFGLGTDFQDYFEKVLTLVLVVSSLFGVLCPKNLKQPF